MTSASWRRSINDVLEEVGSARGMYTKRKRRKSEQKYDKEDRTNFSAHNPEHGFGTPNGTDMHVQTCMKCGEIFTVTEEYIQKVCKVKQLSTEQYMNLLDRFFPEYKSNK